MYDLEQIKQNILASGGIMERDVADLRKVVYQDGRVNRAEANFLFDLWKDVLNLGNLKAWDEFFIQAICDHLLGDRRSPHAIDNQEAAWLIEKIGEDKIIDEVEQELLRRLSIQATQIPTNLRKIQKHTSIARDLGRRILYMLCHNTRTARTLEYGINSTGHHKPSIFHSKTAPDEDH